MGLGICCVDAVAAASSGGGGLFGAKTIEVSTAGNDTTGAASPYTAAFLTIGAAITAAVSGDTVVVRPGSYTGSSLGKNGVNVHLLSGATITATNVAMFDQTTTMSYAVTGDGTLALSGATSRLLTASGTGTVSIRCKNITGDTTAVRGVFVSSGTPVVSVYADSIVSSATANDMFFIFTNATGGGTYRLECRSVSVGVLIALYGSGVTQSFVDVNHLIGGVEVGATAEIYIRTQYHSVISASGWNTYYSEASGKLTIDAGVIEHPAADNVYSAKLNETSTVRVLKGLWRNLGAAGECISMFGTPAVILHGGVGLVTQGTTVCLGIISAATPTVKILGTVAANNNKHASVTIGAGGTLLVNAAVQ